MSDSTLYILLALVLAVLGFVWIALALNSHWRQVHGSHHLSAGRKASLRASGSLALLLSLACTLASGSLAMSIMLWVMLLAVATLIVALTLSWRPRWLARFWPARATRQSSDLAE
ncbi:DUF3325 domain-containing protein [Pseudomonas sp. HLT2-19-2]